ncbi:MAG: hypothetical protein NC421_03380 [Lachnospiraceae bacterium]|nr:hypothetical protein [Lachnospiraceae bacterium]
MRAAFCLLLSLMIASCTNNTDIQPILDAANTDFINKNYDAAQSELLKAEALVTDDTPLPHKERLERLKGMNYLELRVMDKAKISLQNALHYSKQMGDTSRIIQNSFNLGLCNNTIDEVIGLYESIINLAADAEPSLLPDALEKLAQGYIYKKDFEKAQAALDKASEIAGSNSPVYQQIAFTQCALWLAEDSITTALAGFRSIPADSCSIAGKLSRSNHIYNILCKLGDYKGALAYKDSIWQFSDSIKNIDGANRIRRIEDAHRQGVEKERTRFNVLLYSSSGILIVIATIMIFVLKNLRLKRKQVSLTNQIAELNVKLSELQAKEENGQDDSDASALATLIMEKFSLSMMIFKTLPQYELLKKLNLIRDFDSGDKQDIRNLSSEIIGRFSDSCSNLRHSFPSMTNDDCLLCSMSYCGCSKEVVSAIMGSSEEAVRRRKSRVKQKLPETLFSFFFKHQ